MLFELGWYSSKDSGQRWLAAKPVLFRYIATKPVEVDIFLRFGVIEARLVFLHQNTGDVITGFQESGILRFEFLILPEFDFRPDDCLGCHLEATPHG